MVKKHRLSPEQDRAANPADNIWVQANAGTGKTSVLVQRLLRILFRSDKLFSESLDSPGILCLTYTNAGAAEMRNRILKALRLWAGSDDKTLYEMLEGVAINKKLSNADLNRARRLFYKYIDNPDILKIKTIHGFCEEILRRFPLEAGISPTWNLVSDYRQKILLRDTFHRLINSNYYENKQLGNALSVIVERVSENSLDDLLDILTEQYKHFFQVENLFNYREYFIETCKYFLDITSMESYEVSIEKLKDILESAKNDINASKKPVGYMLNLVKLTEQYIDNTIDFDIYKYAYLTSADTKNTNIAKKDYLIEEQNRVYNKNQKQLNEKIFNDTVSLFDLSAAFAQTYKNLKQERNLLDFEDLILYTKKLFSKADTMGWVLSQLDFEIDHILVDEAQDTSPDQWDILRMLSGDFFVEGSAELGNRSLFVVGDTKQSIYSFQGADPGAFTASRAEIAAQIKNNMHTIAEIPLTQSFRSTAAILRVVDHFFGNPDIRNATGFINNDHKCFRGNAPGLVEIHKLISKADEQ